MNLLFSQYFYFVSFYNYIVDEFGFIKEILQAKLNVIWIYNNQLAK